MSDYPSDTQLGEILKEHRLHEEFTEVIRQMYPEDDDLTVILKSASRVVLNTVLYDYVRTVITKLNLSPATDETL